MTFAAAMATLSGLARLLAGDSVDTSVDRTRTAAEGAALSSERLLEDPESFADELAAWHADREIMVLLGRGPARAATEMGALTLKESGVMAESFESAMFRHGPVELAGPEMTAIVMATEPETRRLDLGLAADLVDTGANVMVVTTDGEAPKGARAVATGYLDRALLSAVSIVPVQLLAWRLAQTRGRTPGQYTKASKVTTRE
jgi:glucosamine--fructose-6-phosphate aminotransferase (isomerizing)